jgi:hypothetical protein
MRLHPMREVTGSRFAGIFLAVMIAVFLPTRLAQDAAKVQPQEAVTADNQLAVNWLYGAYVPKDVPPIALTGDERYKLLVVRQSFIGVSRSRVIFQAGPSQISSRS